MCAKFAFKNIKISGISTVVGENKIDIDDELIYYNNDQKQLDKLKKSIGFKTRYIANPNTTTFDLCLSASKKLLYKMHILASDIDAIISVTQTPDYHMPGNAHLIHKALGCENSTVCYDLEFGCSGFIMGLLNAFLFVNAGMKRVLLLTGDTLSKIINIKNRADAPIFGDSGSACIIEKTKEDSPSFFVVQSDGKGSEIMFKKAGAYRYPSSEETKRNYTDKNGNVRCQEDFYMDGFDTFSFTLGTQPKLLKDILEFSGKSVDDIDYYILHQANNYIVQTIVKKMNIDLAKAPIGTFSKYGNQSSASIPGVISYDLSQSFKTKKQVLMQGFGIGLSWGACQTEFSDITIIEPSIYKGET